MLHRLCGPPSIHLSFNLAAVLPRRSTYCVSCVTKESSSPTTSRHRLRRGLPGYLILFATHAFASQRQYRSRSSPSPRVFLLISTNFTSTPGIPRSSPVFKPRSLERTSRVKPGDFTFNLRWPPARPLRPVIPNNAYTPRIAAAAGTELAGVFFKGTITCHAYSTSHHFSP